MSLRRCTQWVLVLAAAAMLLAWLLPIHVAPWAGAYQEFLVFFSALLFVATISLSGEVRISPALLGFLLLPTVPLLQLAFGVIYFAGDALLVSLYLLGFALMLLVGYNAAVNPVGKEYFFRLLAMLFVIGAVLSAWIALRQWLLLSGSGNSTVWVADLPPGARPYANLAQPNNLATLLCMGLAGVLYVYEKRLLGSAAAGLLAAFILTAVALTQSRAPWLAAVAVVLFWWLKSGSYASRLSVYGLLAWVGVYASYILIIENFFKSAISVVRVGSVNERMSIWVQLWQNIWNGPWWGYGWNQVGVAQMTGALNYAAPSLSMNGHNIFIDLMVWNGPLLGSLIFLGMSFWLIRVARLARSAESMFALLAAGFILTHSVVEFPYEYAYLLFPLGLLLGAAAGGGRARFEFLLPRRLVGALLVVCLVVFGWYWREYRVVEEDHRLLRLELARVGTIKAKQSAPDVVLLSQLREFIRFARTPPRSNMSGSDLDRMRKVVYRYPSYSGLLRYIHALALNGEIVMARQYFALYGRLFGHGQRLHAPAMFELENMRAEYPQLFDLLREGGG